MAGVIKSGALRDRGGVKPVAFDFGDVTQRADAYLEQVRVQARELAAQIVEQARREGEETRQAAQKQAGEVRRKAEHDGLAAAREKAAKEAETNFKNKLTAELATLLPVLSRTVAELETTRVALVKHWQENVVQLASAMASRIVRRELSRQPEITLDWIREALELASGSDRLRLHLNPKDCETLRDRLHLLTEQVGRLAPSDIVPDPAVSLGGCRVVTEFGEIDQRIEEQIRRIQEELL